MNRLQFKMSLFLRISVDKAWNQAMPQLQLSLIYKGFVFNCGLFFGFKESVEEKSQTCL